MSNNSDPLLNIEVYVKASNPQLLIGLESWLYLGLINDKQVLKLSSKYLTCPIATTNIIQKTAQIKVKQEIVQTATVVESKPNIISQVWQAFLDELSIRWLLFLGIFLVVISSGVLAASKWSDFPGTAQYTILWLYTLGFWGIGLWLGKQNNLQLTSRTLKNIAILLVPINFWAMNSFNLINHFSGLVVIAIAAVTLTTIVYWQYKNKDVKYWFVPLFLFLSCLHLGSRTSSFSLTAIYISIIAIVTVYYLIFIRQQKDCQINNVLILLSAWLLLFTRGVFINSDNFAYSSLAIALSAWLLATIYLHKTRKILALQIEKKAENSQAKATLFFGKIFQIICTTVILFTWFISLLTGIFDSNILLWQTTGINGLAIHLFSQRLRLYWYRRDLTAIFVIGLQSLLVAKELIPDFIKTKGIALAIEISNTKYLPESVFSVTLFPYIILFIFVATWLYSQNKSALAVYSERLTLVFGIALTILSLYNPTWRSLNLGLSALTLSYVAYIRQPLRVSLIYLSHCLTLLTIVSAIALLRIDLSHMAWGTIILILTVLEWVLLISQQSQPKFLKGNFNKYYGTWYSSSWYFGLLLAGISYVLFLSEINASPKQVTFFWSLAWSIVPLILTIVARYTRSIKYRKLAISLSCVALVASQVLTVTHFSTRFINLALATALMFINVYYLRKTIIAAIHLGLALSLISSVLWELITGWNWLVVSAIAIIGLYRLRHYFVGVISSPRLDYISQRFARGRLGVGAEVNNFKLYRRYAQAADYWAIILSVIALIIMTLGYLDRAVDNNTINISGEHFLITSILIGCAILARYRQQSQIERENTLLTNSTGVVRLYDFQIVTYTLAWIIELAVFSLITTIGGGTIAIATANIILGLLSLWLIPQLTSNSQVNYTNLFQIPLLYAGLGIYWRLSDFNTYTGFLTLGASLIGIAASKHSDRNNKTITYFSLAGISLGIYELVVYQMSRSSGGNIADGFTILSLVAAAIAFAYRLTAWWWRKQNKQFLFNLNLERIIIIAHIHWAISSILKIIAAGIAIETATPRLTIISIAVSFFLGA